jgi:hypothetical protein
VNRINEVYEPVLAAPGTEVDHSSANITVLSFSSTQVDDVDVSESPICSDRDSHIGP